MTGDVTLTDAERAHGESCGINPRPTKPAGSPTAYSERFYSETAVERIVADRITAERERIAAEALIEFADDLRTAAELSESVHRRRALEWAAEQAVWRSLGKPDLDIARIARGDA